MASTLAESLLDDLDDLSDLDEGEDEVEVEVENNEVGAQKAEAPGRSSSTGAANADDDGDADMNSASITGEASGSGSGPGSASATTIFKKKRRLVDDPKLQLHLKAIQTSLDANANTNNNANYNLMTACNKYLIAVQNELIQTHGDIILAYKPKFPELEELLPDAMAYKNAIKVLQNELDITLVTEQLMTDAHLTSNQIITLSVASSTTVGESLTSSQLAHVNHCISYFEQVLHIKSHLLGYIEVHMESMAPNTCILIGPTLAARIVATAGGMAELSRIPACNLQVLGQVRATAASRAGLSTSIAMASATSGAANSNLLGAPNMAMNMNMHMPRPSKPHEGMISESELYRRVPPPLQRKALKVICAKLALAIRCDYVNLTSGRKNSTESGMKFRAEIERKFAKLIEPDLAPVNKALPKPDMETKKRRGGKRMRLIKEKFAETEMMKQANRRVFSTETGEYGDDAMGLTLGMLEKNDGSGNIRHRAGSHALGNKRKARQANTKASRKRAAQMGGSNGGADMSGLATSVVFTPVQGLELVNPDAMKEKVRKANNKWFSEDSGFQSALPKKR